MCRCFHVECLLLEVPTVMHTVHACQFSANRMHGYLVLILILSGIVCRGTDIVHAQPEISHCIAANKDSGSKWVG